MILINSFLQLVLIILALNAGYIFILSVAGLFAKKQETKPHRIKQKFAILIPAYQYDGLVLESAPAALKQQYPENLFDVFVIADHLRPDTVTTLRKQGITVFEAKFDKSTKAKSLSFALNQIEDHVYQYALILDIDNLLQPDVLEKLNAWHQKGFKVVQAHRTTRNLNTNFAILDAVSEEINNHVHRRAHRMLGLASILIGSGMSFEFWYLKMLMQNIHSSVEDKELEMAVLQDRYDIAYVDDALVYDEKVARSEVFANQRIRWVYSQLYALKLHFKKGILSIFHNNPSYFFKTIELMLIPKVMLLGFLVLFFLLSLLTGPVQIAFGYLIVLTMYCLALLFAVPKHFFNNATLMAVLSIPKAFVLMTATLFKLKKAKESFIPTLHEKS